ncbi:MAG: uroporphyrinogen-III C-methyltransferase [Gammaproteobacteria bacterium]|nr:uroporphyrinogen-III C-methyltransferase [Gammaproteobacteria bacterium]
MAELEDIDAPTPAPRAGRSGLGLLACVLALAALACSGYLYWQLVWRAGDGIDARFEELAAEFAREEIERAATDEAARAEREQLADDLAAQVQVLATTRAALARSTAGQAAAVSHAPRDWQLAEVEYLLRLANHRLRLERDADGAMELLSAADEILARIDDFAFHEVRALLAEETASLRAFEGADVAGVFLRLGAAKGLIDQLPLRLPEYVGERAEADEVPVGAPADAERSLIEALLARADGLVRFRRHDLEARRPLLPADEVEDLERYLRLALDRAQLAALRRDQAIYAASLSTAADALDAFVDPTGDAAAALGTEIEALLAVDLAKPLPDISGSLTKLRDLRRVTADNG